MINFDVNDIYKDYPVYLDFLEKLNELNKKKYSFKRKETFNQELEEYQFLLENRDFSFFDNNGLYEDELYLFQHEFINQYVNINYEYNEKLRELYNFLFDVANSNIEIFNFYFCLKGANKNYKFIDLGECDYLSIQEDDNDKIKYLIAVLQAGHSFVATIRQEDIPFIVNLFDNWSIIPDAVKGEYYSPMFENAPKNMGLIYYQAYMKDKGLAKLSYPCKFEPLVLSNNNQYDDSFFDRFDDSELVKKMFTTNIEKLYKKCNFEDKEKILNYYRTLSTCGYQYGGDIISLFTTSPVINIELLKRKYLKK